MSYSLISHVKIKSIVSLRRPLVSHFKIKAQVTNRRPLVSHFKIKAKIARTIINQVSHCKIKAKIRKPGFLDTMFNVPTSSYDMVIPSVYEIREILAIRAFVQLPDSGTEIQIPKKRIEEFRYRWEPNKEIQWYMTLINFDRALVGTDSEWRGMFEDNLYNYYCGRKFIKVILTSWCKDKYVDFTLPRLVIEENPQSGNRITISGYDYITKILTQEVNLPSFCAMEALSPIQSVVRGEVISSKREFKVNTLTNNYITELYVNYQLATTGWTYNPETRIVSFSFDIPENYVVFSYSPISKQKAIQSICDQAVNKLPSSVTKEYIKCNFGNLPLQYFDAELACFGLRPRDVIQKLLNSFPGNYLIMPNSTDLSLNFYKKVLGNEYPKPKWYLPETLMFGDKIKMPKSSARSFTFGHIKRPSRVYDSQVSVPVIT